MNDTYRNFGDPPNPPTEHPSYPRTFDDDTGERTPTEVRIVRPADTRAWLLGRFTCGHGRTDLRSSSFAPARWNDRIFARLLLLAHVQAFGCDCIRPEWEARFGECLSEDSVACAHRWAEHITDADEWYIRVRHEFGTPPSNLASVAAARPTCQQPEAIP